MPTLDPRIDVYIAKAADFARPILESLRDQIHSACPQVAETIKWGMPHFIQSGGVLCYMAAFKKHVAVGFRKAALLDGIPHGKEKDAMGQFGRLLSVSDLPSRQTLSVLLEQAAKLNAAGISLPAGKRVKTETSTTLPRELKLVLAGNPAARSTYEKLPPGEQREYRNWIAEAKREETRERRAAQAVEWLAQGKRRNWKYNGRKQ